jgi:hypothetical protein
MKGQAQEGKATPEAAAEHLRPGLARALPPALRLVTFLYRPDTFELTTLPEPLSPDELPEWVPDTLRNKVPKFYLVAREGMKRALKDEPSRGVPQVLRDALDHVSGGGPVREEFRLKVAVSLRGAGRWGRPHLTAELKKLFLRLGAGARTGVFAADNRSDDPGDSEPELLLTAGFVPAAPLAGVDLTSATETMDIRGVEKIERHDRPEKPVDKATIQEEAQGLDAATVPQAAFMLARLERAERKVAQLREAVREELQSTFDDLAGKRARDPKIDAEIAERARKLAMNSGCQPYSNGRPAYFRWSGSVYQALTTNSARDEIDSSATFLAIEVRLRGEGKS